MTSVDFSTLRTRMVDSQVRTTDVTDLAIIDAMLSVPREKFVPARWRELAYIDTDVEIDAGSSDRGARYLMEPSPFAKLLQLASIKPGDFVLDVGTGTGYSAAILSKIASSVVALESDPTLASGAAERLAALGCDNVAVVEGNLAAGHASEAPYDVIVVEGAVQRPPEGLFGQLRDGGRLVVIEGLGNTGVAKAYIRDGETVAGRPAFNAAVRLLPGFEVEPSFTF